MPTLYVRIEGDILKLCETFLRITNIHIVFLVGLQLYVAVSPKTKSENLL